ncbi:copper oxidase [soil metagenome]
MNTPENSDTVNSIQSTLTRRGILQAGAFAGGSLLLCQRAALAQPGTLRPRENDSVKNNTPARNTERAAGEHLPPGEAGTHYTPVIVPNGWTLPYNVVDGVKVFHLVAEEVEHPFADGLIGTCWGYNGGVHGPVLEAVEGDRVRIFVTNKLKAFTTVHWHGLLLPSGMDGVGGLTQAPIAPGETFMYEFTLRQHGTLMYHSHHDEMTQMGLGMVGMFVIHPRAPKGPRPDKDFAIMLHEWAIHVGASRPDTNEMTDFNVLTMNAKVFPATHPLVVQLGERVRIRLGNLGAMDHHPIHLHGYSFTVTETDGGVIPEAGRWPETTVLVPVGSTRTVEFSADNPGDWAMHCHMTHHVMNQMGHDAPNMVGVDSTGLDEKIRKVLPNYMTMGQDGMAGMTEMGMEMPPNSIPMVGGMGPGGEITMGGMFTILKVRESLADPHADPGWYAPPAGTLALPATDEALRAAGVARDGSDAPKPPAGALRPHKPAPS